MNKTLIASKPMFYRHRALTAGQTFEATPIDAQHFISRGHAVELPAAAPVAAPVVAPPSPAVEAAPVEVIAVAEEPVAEVIAAPAEPEPPVEADAQAPEAAADPAAPTRRPYTRRRNASSAAE